MAKVASPWQPISVYARWRPLTDEEVPDGEIDRNTFLENNQHYSIVIKHPVHRPWKSAGVFKNTYEPVDDNINVYETAISQALPKVLQGSSCNFFAYGHSGSGKTHTIIGYDYEVDSKLGLSLAASQHLFAALDVINQTQGRKLGIGFSLFELRKNVAFDLLNGRTECHIRQGADGKTHIRGPTELLEDGKVRVRPIVKRSCWTFDSLKEEVKAALGLRTVGSSTVHDQSSRTHAVLELEIVNNALAEARDALTDRQSELVPVGKRADDIGIEEAMKSLIRNEDGTYRPNPDHSFNQERVDAANAEKAKYEAAVRAAEGNIASVLESETCLGGKFVFVDLAGSEYQHEKGAAQPQIAKQTPQERQEGRQINTDLLALKEVIRACSSNQTRIPFRLSPLTMVLREHFLNSKDGTSAMIVTVSPAKKQYAATLNSLKYGSLVGAASA